MWLKLKFHLMNHLLAHYWKVKTFKNRQNQTSQHLARVNQLLWKLNHWLTLAMMLTRMKTQTTKILAPVPATILSLEAQAAHKSVQLLIISHRIVNQSWISSMNLMMIVMMTALITRALVSNAQTPTTEKITLTAQWSCQETLKKREASERIKTKGRNRQVIRQPCKTKMVNRAWMKKTAVAYFSETPFVCWV